MGRKSVTRLSENRQSGAFFWAYHSILGTIFLTAERQNASTEEFRSSSTWLSVQAHPMSNVHQWAIHCVNQYNILRTVRGWLGASGVRTSTLLPMLCHGVCAQGGHTSRGTYPTKKTANAVSQSCYAELSTPVSRSKTFI